MKNILSAPATPLTNQDTLHIIHNLTVEPNLSALWRIQEFCEFIQGVSIIIMNIITIGTSTLEALNNLFGAHKTRFASRLSFDLCTATIASVVMQHNNKIHGPIGPQKEDRIHQSLHQEIQFAITWIEITKHVIGSWSRVLFQMESN
jgi:hypothetical protein